MENIWVCSHIFYICIIYPFLFLHKNVFDFYPWCFFHKSNELYYTLTFFLTSLLSSLYLHFWIIIKYIFFPLESIFRLLSVHPDKILNFPLINYKYNDFTSSLATKTITIISIMIGYLLKFCRRTFSTCHNNLESQKNMCYLILYHDDYINIQFNKEI